MTDRTRLVTGLAVLVALWLAAAAPALSQAVEVVSARVTADRLSRPTGELVLALEAERRLSTEPAGPTLTAQWARTDEAELALRTVRKSWISWLADSDATRQADELLARADRLAGVRATVVSRSDQVVDAYTALIDPEGLTTPTVHPDEAGAAAAGLSALSRARELLAEQDAQLAAVAHRTRLGDADRIRLSSLAGARRNLLVAAGNALPTGSLARFRQVTADGGLNAAENQLIAGTGGASAAAAWSAGYNRLNTGLWEVQDSAAREAATATSSQATVATVRAGLVGGVGLIAVVAVLVMARRSARTATGVRGVPDGQGRAAEAAPHHPEPLLRDLERRNQGLLHRQLRLLDALTRRASEDETLGDLFRADHLATRMRRNLEKSITLAGGTPGRRWRRPVPLGEVVRGAAAEIAEYHRVSTSQIEPAHLAGAAVTDLMHLLAELMENAATFAPAETRVRVTGAFDLDDYRITVADVGPGMTDDDLATAAEVMAAEHPPTGGTWWGLYAAGRFAARQGITVGLGNSPDGGLLAEVVVPGALISPATPATDDEASLDDLATVTP
jgi:nitrate/nitrite sensing protein/histidine kinase/DNA gyrase B/HSP90-like ATPase